MRFSAETTTDGVTERLFTIGDAPGAVWAPAGARGPRPLVLLGLEEPAARLTVPVEFHLQWDDELVPRADGLALFDAIGSKEKTLHANPGRHVDGPAFEVDSTERFFARHLASHGDQESRS